MTIGQQVYAGFAAFYLGLAGLCLAYGHGQMAGVFLVGVASCAIGLYVHRDRG